VSQTDGAPVWDELVARAIRQLTRAVPGAEEGGAMPETPSTSQPWAETASPSSKNKRPLDALLEEYAARVAAAPGARARLPSERHPSVAFYDRFGTAAAPGEGRRRRRRRAGGRRRRGEGGEGRRRARGG
jgi:hypothetical protein